MPTNFSSTTLSGTYNDDYDENSNFHQILFNSGRALQARELTQLQTLVYQEMGRLGRNIFKEGSAISAGPISINSEYDYVQIETVQGGAFEVLGATSPTQGIEIGTIFQSNIGVRARVLDVKPLGSLTGIDVDTLYIQYINSNNQAISADPVTFQPEQTLTQVGGNGYVLTTPQNASANAQAVNSGVVGKGTTFSSGEGDFFVLGRFVHANAQSLLLSPYTNTVTAEVGFKVIQEVVTVNDTVSLFDNSNGGIPNTASPGADRYRITLTLTDKANTTVDDTFVFIARLENSTIVEEVKETDAYNKINDVLALRTNEESGDYIVNPFTLDVDSADTDNLKITVSSGVAYVNGYRAEIPSPVELLIPRSTGSGETIENDVVPITYGNYVLVDSAGRIPDLSYDLLTFRDVTGASLGTARARGLESFGDQFKLYLFDIEPTGDLSRAKTLNGQAGQGYYFIDNPSDSDGRILSTLDNDLLFPTTRPRPKTLDNITIVKQKYYRSTNAASGNTIIVPTVPGETFAERGSWIVMDRGDDENVPVNGGVGAFIAQDVSASGIVTDSRMLDNIFYDVLYYVQKTATTAVKTLSSSTASITGVAGNYDFALPDVDVVTVIQDVPLAPAAVNSGNDVSERFIFDDGQRDNYYANSKLILKEGETDPGTIYVEYQYFTRTTGDFYTPASYNSVPYSRIPEHILQDGTVINLRNYIDFRPDKDNSGVFSNVKYLPKNGANLTGDINYHLPRVDKLLITQEGDLQMLMGQQSKDPQLKKTPDNALELYQILMGANTANEDDVQIKAIEHKRYTMSDISKLDEKVEQLKQYTELNIAELRAYHSPSLDSAGDQRPDAGIIVDDLTDQTGSQTDNDDYAASLDPENNLIRPKADEDNVRLIKQESMSSGVVFKGDNVYLDYDETQWLYQDLASRFINPNPYGSVDNVGVIKLSPSSDEWKDAKEEAIKSVLGSSKLANKQAFLWNNWQWNWKGRNNEDVWVGNDESAVANSQFQKRASRFGQEVYNSNPNTRGAVGYVRRIVRRDTLRQRIGNRIIDLALIPWMRSRKIYFKAQGLKPGTIFTPFFDGVDVSAWCKPESAFVSWAEREDDNGNRYTYSSLTGHPETIGQTGAPLISDANGEVIGSFWIPNLKPLYYISRKNAPRKIKQRYLRFRAGIREFKLLDVNINDWSAASSKAFAYYSVVGAIPFKWNNIVSSRSRAFNAPLGIGWAGFPAAYSPSELKQTLDLVAAANVNIISPQVAGQYGPDNEAVNPALGIYTNNMSKIVSDYIYVNQKQFAGTNVKPLNMPANPLSQTFYVDNQFGLTLSKISLFFHSKPSGNNLTDNMPISIHVRPVVDGKPSNTEIVPDSHVFLNSGDVDAIVAGSGVPTLTVIQSRPTEFVFEEPIFLQPWTHYAIVVTTQSTEYKLFYAKTQDNVYGSTARKVTTQPSSGSLFLPQNGLAWSEAKDQDLMMKITRCDFNKSLGGGSLILRNGPLSAGQLDNNPVKITFDTTLVHVNFPCSGLMENDLVVIDSCGDISNIIADTYLNGPLQHRVTAADIHGFTFDYAETTPGAPNADATISGGGDRVLSQRNMVFDVANPNIESIVPNYTSIDVSAKFSSGVHASGLTSNRFKPNGLVQPMNTAKYERITPDQNIEFDGPRAIYHSGVEDDINSSGLGGADIDKKYSTYFKIDMKTSNGYVSPIVDLQRASLTIVGECIDDGNTSNQINGVEETSPTGGSAGSKHITTPVTTEIPAVGLDIRSEVYLPANSSVDCYYRIGSADQNISELNWILAEPVQAVPTTGSNVTTELKWLPGKQNGTLNPFQQSQVKFVMKGIDKGPQLKNISIRTLAV